MLKISENMPINILSIIWTNEAYSMEGAKTQMNISWRK